MCVSWFRVCRMLGPTFFFRGKLGSPIVFSSVSVASDMKYPHDKCGEYHTDTRHSRLVTIPSISVFLFFIISLNL